MSSLQHQSHSDAVLIISDLGSGGAQRVVSSLVEAWVRKGRHIHVVTISGADTDFFHLPAGVSRSTVCPRKKPVGRLAAHYSNIKAIFHIRRLLRMQRPRAVLSFITATNILVILAAFGLGLRVVISERNDPQRQSHGPLWDSLRRLLYRFSSAVTANSEHAVEVMTAYVPRRRLNMIPNPVVLPEKLAQPAIARTVLNVGRLVPQKGQADVIAAFSRVADTVPEWRLTILGEGPERGELTAQADKAGLGDRISLPGNMVDPLPYYRDAGVFVMASRYEGTPNALLEAMAHGVPCIVSNSLPGALEHVEDWVSGLVFRSGDATHLADCLLCLITDAELRVRLGLAARERMKLFAPERVLAEWDDLLYR